MFLLKFDGDSNGDIPEAHKPYLDPLNGPYLPNSHMHKY